MSCGGLNEAQAADAEVQQLVEKVFFILKALIQDYILTIKSF